MMRIQNLPKPICGMIFDCDGVMIDSEEANRYFYNKILSAVGLPPMTAEQEKFAFMATAREALMRMTPKETHARLEEIAKTAMDYEKDILPRTKLMPGFRDFLHKAHDLGLKLAIDTNRTDIGIQRILDYFELPPYFNPVISASSCEPKPSPQGVRRICDAWGAASEQVIFVGDSENDRLAARNAGTWFAAFGENGLAGDFEAPNYEVLFKDIKHLPPRERPVNDTSHRKDL